MGEYTPRQQSSTVRALAAIEQATDDFALYVVAERTGADPDVRARWVDRIYADLAAMLPDPVDLLRAIVLLIEVQANQRGMDLVNAARAIKDPGDLLDGPWSGPCPGCPQCQPARWSVL